MLEERFKLSLTLMPIHSKEKMLSKLLNKLYRLEIGFWLLFNTVKHTKR